MSKNEILKKSKQLVHNREGWTARDSDFVIYETSDHGWCVTVQRRERDKLEVAPDGVRMILMSPGGTMLSYIHQ